MFAKFRYDKGSGDNTVHMQEKKNGKSKRKVDTGAANNEEITPKKRKIQNVNKLQRKWQERYHSICPACFEKVVECTHYVEKPLRLLIVGHNPSDHAWTSKFLISIFFLLAYQKYMLT